MMAPGITAFADLWTRHEVKGSTTTSSATWGADGSLARFAHDG
jgi:hypothetical protein